MKEIITVFKKEFLDTIRDRRTLMTMIVMPVVVIPLLLSMITSFAASKADEASKKTLKVGLIDESNSDELMKEFRLRKDFTLMTEFAENEFNQLIRDDSIDIAIVIPKEFGASINQQKTGTIKLYHKDSGTNSLKKRRVVETIERFEDKVLAERLDSIGITDATIDPVSIEENNVYSMKETIGKQIGSSLPYLFVLFCFMGCMYPAIDLFAGEKERGTLETILSSPVNRLSILFGKMGVVTLTGLITGMLIFLGAYLVLIINKDIPDMISNIIFGLLKPSTMSLILLMLLPTSAFFASILIAMSIYAKSFKEALTLIQPLTFLIIIPLLIPVVMEGSMALTPITAMIPLLNLTLATGEIMAGTIDMKLLAIVVLSLFAFAAIAVLLCTKWFGREENILRT